MPESVTAVLPVVVSLAIVVAAVVSYLTWAVLANRRRGIRGLVRTVHLACPKCRASYDYDFVPGASITSLRLGRSRYMACPFCHKWSVFRVSETTRAPFPPSEARSGPPLG